MSINYTAFVQNQKCNCIFKTRFLEAIAWVACNRPFKMHEMKLCRLHIVSQECLFRILFYIYSPNGQNYYIIFIQFKNIDC